LFANVYSHRGVDKNGDGRYEAVAIDVTLDVAQPGTYRVEGDLFSNAGDSISHASWTGSGTVATLVFDLDQTRPPYRLENLKLFGAGGVLLDSRQNDAYTVAGLDGPVSLGRPA